MPVAKIFSNSSERWPIASIPTQELIISGPDGRFEFVADKQVEPQNDYERYAASDTVVAASAFPFGIALTALPADGPSEDLRLELVTDDVPITGQIVDLEGKPVTNANIQVLDICATADENLDHWLEAAKDENAESWALENEHCPRLTFALSPSQNIDAEGRFHLKGIGRNRLVRVKLVGPTISSQFLNILTRPGQPIIVPLSKPLRINTTYYGANFRHVSAPTKPLSEPCETARPSSRLPESPSRAGS